MATPVQMPQPGNTVEECLLVEWAVPEGEPVTKGQVVCTIETDKATFEVESPADGTLVRQFVSAGEVAPVLTTIGAVGEPGEDVSDLAPTSAAPSQPAGRKAAKEPKKEMREEPRAESPAPQDPQSAASAQRADGRRAVSPRARKLAARLGVDPTGLQGSGPQGRVVSDDVQAAAGRLTPLARAEQAATGRTAQAPSGLGGRARARDLVEAAPQEAPPEEIPLTQIRARIAERMRASLAQHAQLTLHGSADATALLALRRRFKEARSADEEAPNVTLNAMICAAAVWTLPAFPELNATFDPEAEKLVRYSQVHLGVAVDTDRGLMVPVVRNAHAMRLSELTGAIAQTAAEARSGAIDPDRLYGGTFTITNLGALGVERFTPVLNSPQVSILGVCAIEERPVPDGAGGVRFQPALGLSLTIDHQVVDGAPAARFLQALAQSIGTFDFALAQQAV